MQTSVFIAASLDGFIARENGSLDWLPPIGQDKEDYGYQEFIDAVDAIVMGRRTYETALAFESWPYGVKPVIVLSSQKVRIPGHRGISRAHVSFSARSDEEHGRAGIQTFVHRRRQGYPGMTEVFETGMGLIAGDSWEKLLYAHNISAGQVWIFIPLGMLVGPYAFFRCAHRK